MGVSKKGVPQNGWFIMKNHIKMDDLGVPLFLETSIIYIYMYMIWYDLYNVFTGITCKKRATVKQKQKLQMNANEATW